MWLNRGVCRPEVRLPVADHHPRHERPSVITIGIDPHKRSVTAVALDAHSQPLGTLRVAMTDQAVAQLLAWAGPGWGTPWRSSWSAPARSWSMCLTALV